MGFYNHQPGSRVNLIVFVCHYNYTTHRRLLYHGGKAHLSQGDSHDIFVVYLLPNVLLLRISVAVYTPT